MNTMVQSPPTGQDHQPASPAVVLATPAPMAAEQLGQEAKTLVCSTSGQPTGGSSFQEPAGLAVEQAGKLPTPTGLARDTTEGLQLQLAVNEPAFPRQQTYQEKEMGRGSREAAPPSRTGEEMLADLEESEPQLEASELLHIENSVQQHVASGLLGSPQEPPAPTEVIGLQTHQPLLEQQLGQPVLSTVGSPPQDKVMQPGSGQERSKLPGLGLKTAAQEEPTCEVQARGAEPMASPPGPLAPTGSLLEVGTPQPDQQRQHGGGEPQPQCLQDDPPYMTQPIPPALQAPPAASLGQDMGPLPPQPQEEIEQPQPLLHLEEAPVTTAQTGRAEPASDELSAVRSTLDTEPLQVPLQEEQGQSMQLRQPFLEETTTCKPQAVGAEPPLPAPEAANIVAFQGDVIPLPQMQQADQGQSQPPQHQQEGSVGNAEAVGAEPVLPATETPTDRSSGLEVSTLPPQQQQQQGDPQGQPEQLPLQQENTDGTEQLTEAQVQPPAPAAGEGTKSLLEVPSLTSSQQQQQVEEFQQAQQQEHLLQRDQHHQLDEHQDESPKQAQHVRPGAEHPQQQGGPPQLLPHLEIPRQEEVGPQQAAGESKEAQPSHIGQLVVPLPQQLQQVASPAAGPEELAHLITQVEQRDIQRVPPSTRLQCEDEQAAGQQLVPASAILRAAMAAPLPQQTCSSSSVQGIGARVAATADSGCMHQLQEQDTCAPPSFSEHCSSVFHALSSQGEDGCKAALYSQPSSWQRSSEAPSLAMRSGSHGHNSPSLDGLAAGCSGFLSNSAARLCAPCSNSGQLTQDITITSRQQLAEVPPCQLTGSSKREPSEDVPLSSMPDASALVLHSQALQVHHQLQPLARPLTAFPVQRIQAAMGSGLTVMRDRLKTAVERETNLRLETELAAVDQLEALQARALAEANSEVERQARVLAEQEVEQLRSTMQDERRRTQQEVIQLRSELKASHAAIKALEKQVASLQAELGAAVQQKTSAEQQLERVMQRQARPMTSIPAMHADSVAAGHLMVPPQAELDDSSGIPSKPIPGLPYLGRLQQDSATPTKPGKTPRPFLADVRQWLQGKQQEAAPWASPAAIASPPRPRTGRPGTSSLRSAAQQVQEPAPWAQQASPSRPQTGWQRQSLAAFETSSGFANGSLKQGQEGVPPSSAQAGSQLGEPGLGFMSGSDPDSPQQQPLARRRQQQKYTRAQSWNFKPAWTDDSGGRIEPRGSGRNIAAAGGSRVDQVLNDLNDGLEQLRRSYSPPGSPYHTATTVPVQTPVLQPQAVQPPLPQQQYGTAHAPLPPPAVPVTWGYQPGFQPSLPLAQPYGFDARSLTSLLMPAGAPAAAPALPPVQQAAPGGPPIVQYISTYHSPGCGAAADPVSRPQTAAYLGMQQSVSQPWGQQPAYNTAFVQQPFPYLGHQTQYQLPAGQPQPSYMPPQFAERPHTPAVGLSSGPMPGSLAMPACISPPGGGPAICQELPVSPNGVLAAGLPSRHPTAGCPMPGTARPKSSARNKDKPLAVPPQQMDEGSLAAARMEYLLDKHRVKAKRMRELQESPSFSLGD